MQLCVRPFFHHVQQVEASVAFIITIRESVGELDVVVVLLVKGERQLGCDTEVVRAVFIGTITVSEIGSCCRLRVVQQVVLEDVLVSVVEVIAVVEREVDVVVVGRTDIEEAIVVDVDVTARAVPTRSVAVEGIAAQQAPRVWRHQAVHPCLAPALCHVLCQRRTRGVGVVRPVQVFQRDVVVEVYILEGFPQCARLSQTYFMACVQTSVIAAAREERATVGVAALEEGLARGVVGLFAVGVGSFDAALIAEVLAFLVETVGSQGVARGDSPLLSQRRPLALLAWRAVVAQVVDVGEECDARVRGVAHGKGSAKEGWGFRRLSEVLLTAESFAYAAFRIREPRRVVVALQSHVHHHLFLCRLLANGALHVVGRPLVASDVLHHVGWHVVEEQLAVAVEEVLAVEQQGIHLSAVHGYLSAAFQLHARQLLDECVEHRAFCHREGIRVIDQRVAVHVEFQLRGLHHKLIHDGGGVESPEA